MITQLYACAIVIESLQKVFLISAQNLLFYIKDRMRLIMRWGDESAITEEEKSSDKMEQMRLNTSRFQQGFSCLPRRSFHINNSEIFPVISREGVHSRCITAMTDYYMTAMRNYIMCFQLNVTLFHYRCPTLCLHQNTTNHFRATWKPLRSR